MRSGVGIFFCTTTRSDPNLADPNLACFRSRSGSPKPPLRLDLIQSQLDLAKEEDMSKVVLSPTELSEVANRIRSLRQAATLHAIEIGRELLRVKAGLPHGAFVKWVEKECKFKIRTAQDLMKLAREVDPNAEVTTLMVPSTLRVYLSKNTPPEARQLARTRLQNGECVSRKDINAFVSKRGLSDGTAATGSSVDRIAGPELLRSGDASAESEINRSRRIAELLAQRLTQDDYQYLMDGMTWGVWNRVLIWLRTAKIATPDRTETVAELPSQTRAHALAAPAA